jgi:hypothetical protein
MRCKIQKSVIAFLCTVRAKAVPRDIVVQLSWSFWIVMTENFAPYRTHTETTELPTVLLLIPGHAGTRADTLEHKSSRKGEIS